MAQITWTSEAERWLRDIFDYIARDDIQAAIKVVDEIYQKAQILESQPRIGYRYEHESDEDVRILLYGHYRITYLLKTDGDVIILGVFHGAMQIENYLTSDN